MRFAEAMALRNLGGIGEPIHDRARASARMSSRSIRRGLVPELPGTIISLRAHGQGEGRASLTAVGLSFRV